jgi:hypothetical protein
MNAILHSLDPIQPMRSEKEALILLLLDPSVEEEDQDAVCNAMPAEFHLS